MDKYNPKNLYVGKLCYFPQKYQFFQIDDIKITEQKYIFEKISSNEYKEVFSGIKSIEWPELSSEQYIPYITSLQPLTNYVPELLLTENVSTIELLVALDKINFENKYMHSKEYKKTNNF